MIRTTAGMINSAFFGATARTARLTAVITPQTMIMVEGFFFCAIIHEQSLKVLAETGCVFDDEKARNVLQKHGARVDGNVVYFTKELVEKGLSTVVDSLELYRPDGTIYQMGHGSKSMCTAGSPPYILEDGKFRFAVMDATMPVSSFAVLSAVMDIGRVV